MTKGLNLRERRFLDAYLGSCAGNATKAAIAAGYSRRSAQVTSSRLLSKAMVRETLEARVKRELDASIATAEERDRILSEIMRNGAADANVRVRAIAELNKCTGRHSMTHLIKGKLRLEDALQQSREP